VGGAGYVVTCENVLLKETNKEGYSIAFQAKFEEPLPVRYSIRVTATNARKADYTCKLKCFNTITKLLTALQYFAETELYPKDTKKLKNVLTAENINIFADILKSTRI